MFDIDDRKKAIEMIQDALREAETPSDRAYVTGLIEMAYELKVITLNQKNQYLLLNSKK